MLGFSVCSWSEELDSRIKEFVNKHKYGMIYYTPQFQVYLARLSSAENCSLIALQGQQVVGLLPILSKMGPYGRVLNTLPFFGSNGGVLSSSSRVTNMLVDAYNSLVSDRDVALATWISHPFIDFGIPEHEFVDERVAQWTPLQRDEKFSILERIDGSARRNVAKAHRSGILVKKEPAELEYLESEHRRNMQVIGGRQKPKEFFTLLHEHLLPGKDWHLYTARKMGKLVAAILTFEAAQTVEYVMPAASASEKNLQPTAAILEYAMGDVARRGFTIWNWGGTWLTQGGVYRFKKKWGASERRYRYYITLNDKSLLSLTPHELSEAYPWFYLIPYKFLNDGLGI